MFDVTIETVEEQRVVRYVITRDGDASPRGNRTPLTYRQVIDLWQHSEPFRTYFTTLLAEAPFVGYRWETPALTTANTHRPFEFVVVNSPSFGTRRTDSATYQSYFTTAPTDEGIVTFANLRGDAQLIVPSPRTKVEAYGHLAAFVRQAPAAQVDALWRVTGQVLAANLHEHPTWLRARKQITSWLLVK